MMHTRWFCHTCRREWVFALSWQPEDGCPGCHGSQVEHVTYTAAFPGGDLPRSRAEQLANALSHQLTEDLTGLPAPSDAVTSAPPLTLVAAPEDEIDDRWVKLGGEGS